jgi:hypothetical protein
MIIISAFTPIATSLGKGFRGEPFYRRVSPIIMINLS